MKSHKTVEPSYPVEDMFSPQVFGCVIMISRIRLYMIFQSDVCSENFPIAKNYKNK